MELIKFEICKFGIHCRQSVPLDESIRQLGTLHNVEHLRTIRQQQFRVLVGNLIKYAVS
jgi:hypothetical protein